jgi:hypothetical protein
MASSHALAQKDYEKKIKHLPTEWGKRWDLLILKIETAVVVGSFVQLELGERS